MSLKNIRFKFLFIGQGVNKLKKNIDINKITEYNPYRYIKRI